MEPIQKKRKAGHLTLKAKKHVIPSFEDLTDKIPKKKPRTELREQLHTILEKPDLKMDTVLDSKKRNKIKSLKGLRRMSDVKSNGKGDNPLINRRPPANSVVMTVEELDKPLLKNLELGEEKVTIKKRSISTSPPLCNDEKQNKINSVKQPSKKYKKVPMRDVTELDLSNPKTELSDPYEKYPVLKNQSLITQFLAVKLTNNQKGRLRQGLRDLFGGSSAPSLPDVINEKIQSILNNSVNLTESDLRKVRILHNMLKKAVDIANKTKGELLDVLDMKKRVEGDIEKAAVETGDRKNKIKRYVVFVGNLPVDVTKLQLLQHFKELKPKDIRIPHRVDTTKSAIAYIELENETLYQMALSKHHTMLGNKRINVLYTTQKNSKMNKTVAKGKSAKLQALLRAGELCGSVPLNKKRSHRRAILKMARKKEIENKS